VGERELRRRADDARRVVDIRSMNRFSRVGTKYLSQDCVYLLVLQHSAVHRITEQNVLYIATNPLGGRADGGDETTEDDSQQQHNIYHCSDRVIDWQTFLFLDRRSHFDVTPAKRFKRIFML
jgi:hypothetical protein